jgi:hypothetical protein
MLNQHTVLTALHADAIDVRVWSAVLQIVDVVVTDHACAVRQDNAVLAAPDVVGDKRAPAQNGSVGVSAAGAGSDEVAVLYGEVRRGFAVDAHQPKFWTRQFWIVTLSASTCSVPLMIWPSITVPGVVMVIGPA